MRLLDLLEVGADQVLICYSNMTFDALHYTRRHGQSVSRGFTGHVSNGIIYISIESKSIS